MSTIISVNQSELQQPPLVALIDNEEWDDAKLRVQKLPEEASSLTSVSLFGKHSKCHPLHLLCKKKELPEGLVEAFTIASPTSVRYKAGPSRALPIHIACRNNAPIHVIKPLASLYPESLLVGDDDGNLPIHLACWFCDEVVVKFLASRCPESLKAKSNKKSQTPLHLACNRFHISKAVVEILLKEDIWASSAEDWQLQLPLHKAVMWQASPAVIELLLDAFPEAVRSMDKHLMTPYSICRHRVGKVSNDPTIKLLRECRRKYGFILVRTRDAMQFGVETVRDKMSFPTIKKQPAAMAA